MRNIILFILLTISGFSYAQISINFNTKTGKLSGFFVKNETGLFAVSRPGHLSYVVLGNVSDKDSIQLIKTINGTAIYAKQLIEINYPTEYYIDEDIKALPISINGYKFTYYNDYYETDYIKGKIKSIGKIRLAYYSDYYLNDKIKGNIKKIGSTTIEYSTNTIQEDILGEITKIGSISISYNNNPRNKKLNGKISKIGKLNIEYFNDYYDDTHNGAFKKIIGNDNRFKLLTNY